MKILRRRKPVSASTNKTRRYSVKAAKDMNVDIDSLWDACYNISGLMEIDYADDNSGILFIYEHSTSDYEAREDELIDELKQHGYSVKYVTNNGSNVIELSISNLGNIKSSTNKTRRYSVKAWTLEDPSPQEIEDFDNRIRKNYYRHGLAKKGDIVGLPPELINDHNFIDEVAENAAKELEKTYGPMSYEIDEKGINFTQDGSYGYVSCFVNFKFLVTSSLELEDVIEAVATQVKNFIGKAPSIKASTNTHKHSVKASRYGDNDTEDEDVVIYQGNKKLYEGSIYDWDFDQTFINLCKKPEYFEIFQYWVDSLGGDFTAEEVPEVVPIELRYRYEEADTEYGYYEEISMPGGKAFFEIFLASDQA